MKFNIQNVKKILQETGVKVGFINRLFFTDTKGNKYDCKTYKISNYKGDSNPNIPKEFQYESWEEALKTLTTRGNDIDRVLIYSIYVSQSRISNFEWMSIEQVRLLTIPKGVEIVEEDDIDYADDDIFSELDYELDGNFEIKVVVLNKPTETKYIKIKDLYNNFEEYGIALIGNTEDKIFPIRNIIKGGRKNIYSYKYSKAFHSNFGCDNFDTIQCTSNQKGKYTDIYNRTRPILTYAIKNLDFADNIGDYEAYYHRTQHSKKIEESYLYNDFVYSIDIDSDDLCINDIVLTKNIVEMKKNPINGNYIMSNGVEVSWHMVDVLKRDFNITPNDIIEMEEDSKILVKDSKKYLLEKTDSGSFSITVLKYE